jgi:hypothetical protein
MLLQAEYIKTGFVLRNDKILLETSKHIFNCYPIDSHLQIGMNFTFISMRNLRNYQRLSNKTDYRNGPEGNKNSAYGLKMTKDSGRENYVNFVMQWKNVTKLTK